MKSTHEAEMVNKIFSLVADDGLTIRKLASRLQAIGIPPRRAQGAYGTQALQHVSPEQDVHR